MKGSWSLNSKYICPKTISMTQLLKHTIAHSTRPSLSPQNNNQPTKKLLILTVSWVKVVKNGKILTFKGKVKDYPKLSNFFSLKNMILWHFLKTSLFKPLHFLKWRPIFDDFCSTDRKTQKLFKRLVVGFGPEGTPGRMCNNVV